MDLRLFLVTFKIKLESFLHNHCKGIYFSFILVKTTCHYVEVNRSYSYFPNIVLVIWRGTTYNVHYEQFAKF